MVSTSPKITADLTAKCLVAGGGEVRAVKVVDCRDRAAQSCLQHLGDELRKLFAPPSDNSHVGIHASRMQLFFDNSTEHTHM